MRGTTLVGRGAPLREAERLLDEAGSGRHLHIDGPAGIGRTALLRAVADLAVERGFMVGRARAHLLERDFPFALVRQVFEPLLAVMTAEDRDAVLADVVAPTAPLVWGRPAEPGDPAFNALHGLARLAERLAGRRPLLIVVDDLQWADLASLRWLSYLARRSENHPLLIAAARADGLSSADEQLINELTGSFEHLRLTPLTEADTAKLIADTRGTPADPAFTAACHRATAGNPFLVKTVCAEPATEPDEFASPTVARWVTSQLNRLGTDAVRFARAVVIFGEHAELRTTADLAELDLGAAANIADALIRLNILDEELAFAHPVVRNALNARLSPGERAIGHLRAAHLLNQRDREPELIAGHLLGTEPLGEEWAARALRAAGRKAMAAGAADLAVGYLRRALPESAKDRPEVLAELGRAELRIDPPAAIEHLNAAFQLATDPERTALIAEHLAAAYTAERRFAGDEQHQRALAVLDQAISRLRAADARLSTNLEILAVGISGHVAGMPQAKYVQRLRAKATTDPGAARAVSGTIAYRLSVAGKSRPESAGQARRVIELGPPPAMRDFYAYHGAGLALCHADELAAAERCAEGLLARAAATHEPALAGHGHALRASIAWLAGRLADTVEAAAAAVEIHSTIIDDPTVQGAEVTLVAALIEQDRLDDAARALTDLGPAPERAPLRLHGRGRYRMARGDVRAALADHLAAGRWMVEFGVMNPAVIPWRSHAALAHHALGQPDAAVRLAEEELALAERWGTGRAVGAALRTVGRITGDPAALAASVDALDGSPARLEYAYSLYYSGQDSSRHTGEARDTLRQAYMVAHDCGATLLIELVAAALNRHGARRPRPGPSAQERRVAELAAAGATNREIAEELVLNQRTVEAHLTNVYRKLGIPGRSQLKDFFDPPNSGREV